VSDFDIRATALVSGASDGIGRAIALSLAESGVRVVAVARRQDRLEKLVAEASDLVGSIVPAAADLGSAAGAATALRLAAEVGPVGILVNNVGMTESVAFHNTDDDHWQRTIELNLLSAVRLTRGCLPGMRSARWGRIINIASISARQPDPYLSAYSASKAALVNLSKSLSLAYAKDGITSNCILPGFTDTALMRGSIKAAAEKAGRTPEHVLEDLLRRNPVPVGRIGQPKDIASAVRFLISEEASWITGATLNIDGGVTRSA
jgi:3-oxoacyl-[acyl-carrier protein] reductase